MLASAAASLYDSASREIGATCSQPADCVSGAACANFNDAMLGVDSFCCAPVLSSGRRLSPSDLPSVQLEAVGLVHRFEIHGPIRGSMNDLAGKIGLQPDFLREFLSSSEVTVLASFAASTTKWVVDIVIPFEDFIQAANKLASVTPDVLMIRAWRWQRHFPHHAAPWLHSFINRTDAANTHRIVVPSIPSDWESGASPVRLMYFPHMQTSQRAGDLETAYPKEHLLNAPKTLQTSWDEVQVVPRGPGIMPTAGMAAEARRLQSAKRVSVDLVCSSTEPYTCTIVSDDEKPGDATQLTPIQLSKSRYDELAGKGVAGRIGLTIGVTVLCIILVGGGLRLQRRIKRKRMIARERQDIADRQAGRFTTGDASERAPTATAPEHKDAPSRNRPPKSIAEIERPLKQSKRKAAASDKNVVLNPMLGAAAAPPKEIELTNRGPGSDAASVGSGSDASEGSDGSGRWRRRVDSEDGEVWWEHTGRGENQWSEPESWSPNSWDDGSGSEVGSGSEEGYDSGSGSGSGSGAGSGSEYGSEDEAKPAAVAEEDLF